MLARILERIAELLDGIVEAGVEVDERVSHPQPFPQFVARHDLTGTFKQNLQNSQRLAGQADLAAVSAELACVIVELKASDLYEPSRGNNHGGRPASGVYTEVRSKLGGSNRPVIDSQMSEP